MINSVYTTSVGVQCIVLYKLTATSSMLPVNTTNKILTDTIQENAFAKLALRAHSRSCRPPALISPPNLHEVMLDLLVLNRVQQRQTLPQTADCLRLASTPTRPPLAVSATHRPGAIRISGAVAEVRRCERERERRGELVDRE